MSLKSKCNYLKLNVTQRMETACLSNFEDKIKDGKSPMPLMTCLHVRSDVSAMVYHG